MSKSLKIEFIGCVDYENVYTTRSIEYMYLLIIENKKYVGYLNYYFYSSRYDTCILVLSYIDGDSVKNLIIDTNNKVINYKPSEELTSNYQLGENIELKFKPKIRKELISYTCYKNEFKKYMRKHSLKKYLDM